MPSPADQQQDREQILEHNHAYLAALADGDTQALDDLLEDDYTLTHMTGYLQSKAEWLSQMGEGQFVYHSTNEKYHDLQIDGEKARLVSRVITDATVYGSRAAWRLQSTTDYVRRDGTWVALRTVATTW